MTPDEERVTGLRTYNILDTIHEEEYDDITRLAAFICETPIALISLVDEDRQWFKSNFGLEARETPREQSFCAHAINFPKNTMIVPDARQDERFFENPLVTGDPNIVFYAGVPLVDAGGHALGTLCVIDEKVRELSDEQLIALQALARQVINLLSLRAANRSLAIAKQEADENRLQLSRLLDELRNGSEKDIAIQKTIQIALTTEVDLRTSELQAANASLREVNQELSRSNQLLEEFAHASSHDLKEPVRKIQLFTNLLRSKLADQLSVEHLRTFTRIEAATGRMSYLIDDMLKYSQVTYIQQEKQPVELSKIIQTVLDDLELHIEEKSAMIYVEELPVLKGSERQLQQLFQNLVANSLKYSNPANPPLINITTREISDREVLYAVIDVTDNGIGFDPKYNEKIFQIFQRLHDQNQYSGTGVGLSIARKVAENHNGYITAQSKPGEGAVFSVHLPLH